MPIDAVQPIGPSIDTSLRWYITIVLTAPAYQATDSFSPKGAHHLQWLPSWLPKEGPCVGQVRLFCPVRFSENQVRTFWQDLLDTLATTPKFSNAHACNAITSFGGTGLKCRMAVRDGQLSSIHSSQCCLVTIRFRSVRVGDGNVQQTEGLPPAERHFALCRRL